MIKRLRIDKSDNNIPLVRFLQTFMIQNYETRCNRNKPCVFLWNDGINK